MTQQQLAEQNEREAVTQQQRAEGTARESAMRALVARSSALQGSERDVGALLAVGAYKIEPRLDTLGALVSTFAAASGTEGTIPLATPSVLGVPLPDGHTYAVLEADSAIHLIDLDTQREVDRLPPAPEIGRGSSSSGSRRTGEPSWSGHRRGRGTATSWSMGPDDEGQAVPDVAVPFNVGAMAISPDSRLVALGGDTPARVEVRSLDDGSLIQTVPGLPQPEDFAVPHEHRRGDVPSGRHAGRRLPAGRARGSSTRSPAPSSGGSTVRRRRLKSS